MEGARVRVVFDDQSLLGLTQKADELTQCWILLNYDDLDTISNLASYLTSVFDLRDAPHGLIISMDDFVLPPFESTSILKDNDIICVRRKTSFVAIQECKLSTDEEDEASIEQFRNNDMISIKNEEFEKENLRYQIKDQHGKFNGKARENTPTIVKSSDKKSKLKKRKPIKTLECPKIKKFRLRKYHITDTCNVPEVPNVLCDTSHTIKETKVNTTDDVEVDAPASPNPNTSEILQQNGINTNNLVHTDDQLDKKISRSARRKKAKRKLMREEKKKVNQEIEMDVPILCNTSEKQMEISQPDPTSGSHVESQSPEEHNDEMDDIVFPVVVRPGHIRFETADRAGQKESENNNVHSKEDMFMWNGITNKRKGQKWGRQKLPSFSSHNLNHHHNHSDAENECYSEIHTTPEKPPPYVYDCAFIDFEKLSPLLSLPKKGDVIAYRLVELSSSWTPELSSFRVGEVSHFQEESNTVLLLPVPRHPLKVRERHEEETDDLPLSLYKEDGSLEIDYGSLVEVKVFQTDLCSGTILDEDQMDGWDEIQRALSERKAELCVGGAAGCGPVKESGAPGLHPWAAKRGGLACTIHLLRSGNL